MRAVGEDAKSPRATAGESQCTVTPSSAEPSSDTVGVKAFLQRSVLIAPPGQYKGKEGKKRSLVDSLQLIHWFARRRLSQRDLDSLSIDILENGSARAYDQVSDWLPFSGGSGSYLMEFARFQDPLTLVVGR